MTKNEFYTEWLRHFAKGISKENIEKYVVSTGNYLWHIFSWELLDKSAYLTGDSARTAFLQADKKNAQYIDWFEDDTVKSATHESLSPEVLEGMTEVYVAAPDFSWTYIKTHESMCGPYFMKL